MGLVHAYKKGEVKGSEVSQAIKKAAKSMKKSSTKKYASTKHKGLPNKVKQEGFGGDLKGEDKKKFERARKANGEQLGYKLSGTSDVKEDRDYKEEYKKYGSSTKAKKYRAELNQYNRKKGTYGNGDGKDASHKGGKIVGFEKESTNRGRAEKSRLKKESVTEIDRRAKSQIFSEWNKFEKAYSNFFKTAVKLGKVTTKVTGDKTDEKIIIKNFTTDVGKFYSLMQSWVRGQNESVNEDIKVVPSNKIDSKVWRNMKYDLQKQFYELAKVGADYGVFQNAQGTAKILKQIKNLLHKL